MFRKLSFAAVGLLMMAGVAGADTGERKDFQLAKDITTAINHYTQFTIFDDVSVRVDHGTVTLTGKVTMPYKGNEIEKRVARLDGVREVHNQITVLPVSQSDSQLRAQVARSIYRNANFQKYGLGPNPSIHIIVEHGRVTLTGVVDTEGDRTMAGLLAKRFPALSVKNELKTTAEVQDAGEQSH